MTVEAIPEEELKNKEVPPQEEEEEEEEEESGVILGAGKFLSLLMMEQSIHCGFHKRTAQRKRRKRKRPRRRKRRSLTPPESDFRNFSQAGYILSAKSVNTKTSMQNRIPICAPSNLLFNTAVVTRGELPQKRSATTNAWSWKTLKSHTTTSVGQQKYTDRFDRPHANSSSQGRR